MKHSFLTHFGSMFLLHGLLLFASIQAVQTVAPQTKILRLGTTMGNGAIPLQIAKSFIMSSSTKPSMPTLSQPKKTASKKVTAVQKTESTPAPAVASTQVGASPEGTLGGTGLQGSAQGSEFGNSAAGVTDVRAVYKAELRARIEKNKHYPVFSRRLGQTGTVVVAFTLLADGNIIDVRIDEPSRFERLNASALDAVRKVEKFKPIPKEFGETKMDIKVPVKFITI